MPRNLGGGRRPARVGNHRGGGRRRPRGRRPRCRGRTTMSVQAADGPVRALLVEGVHPVAAELLSAAGVVGETEKRAFGPEELAERLPGVHVLGIRSRTHLTAEVLAAATDLRAVGAFCIGTNQIDLQTATERGIAVFNAPFSNTRSVVELAVA